MIPCSCRLSHHSASRERCPPWSGMGRANASSCIFSPPVVSTYMRGNLPRIEVCLALLTHARSSPPSTYAAWSHIVIRPWRGARPSPSSSLSSCAPLPEQSSKTFVTSLGFSDFVRSKVWKTQSSFLISHKHVILYYSQAQLHHVPFGSAAAVLVSFAQLCRNGLDTQGGSPPHLISP